MAATVGLRRGTWLTILLILYVSITLFMTSNQLKKLFTNKSFKYGSVKLRNYVSKLQVPQSLIFPMDLTIPANSVTFNPITSHKKCFKFQEFPPGQLQADLKITSSTLEQLKFSLQSIYDSVNARLGRLYGDEDEEVDTQMSTEERVELYRDSIDVAVEIIKQTARADPVNQCIFDGFSRNESEAMWWQAEHRLRAGQSCDRYSSLPRFQNIRDYNLLQHSKSGVRVCAPVQIGPLDWSSLILNSSQPSKSSLGRKYGSFLVDNSRGQKSFNLGMKALEVGTSEESRWQRPLTIIVTSHPILRLMTAYEYGIKAGYRKKDQVHWISLFRGKSTSELIKDVEAKISERLSYATNSNLISKLLFVEHLQELDNTVPDTTRVDQLSFREFTWVVINDILACANDMDCLSNVDPLWKPQFVQCSPCAIAYDVLSKMDTLLPDSALLAKLIGKDIVTGQIFRENYSSTENENLPGSVLRSEKINLKNYTAKSSDENKYSELEAAKYCKRDDHTKKELKDFELTLKLYRSKALSLLENISAKEYKVLYIAYTFDFTLFGYTGNEILSNCSAYAY